MAGSKGPGEYMAKVIGLQELAEMLATWRPGTRSGALGHFHWSAEPPDPVGGGVGPFSHAD